MSKSALPKIWWDLDACERTYHRFCLESEAEQVISNLGISTPEIFHILLLKVMCLDLLQNLYCYPMISLSALKFATLYDTNNSSTRSTTYTW